MIDMRKVAKTSAARCGGVRTRRPARGVHRLTAVINIPARPPRFCAWDRALAWYARVLTPPRQKRNALYGDGPAGSPAEAPQTVGGGGGASLPM